MTDSSGVTAYDYDARDRLLLKISWSEGPEISLRYGNGVTNLCQYDVLNRLTNSVWKSNALTLASFYYQLGKAGNRTNLTETLITAVTNRTYSWTYDALYRLRTEAISDFGETGYGLDKVGNRITRAAGLGGLLAQSFSYGSNDWVSTDAYDSNGNTLWSTNGGTGIGPYHYDIENRLTNFNNSVYLGYNGDGSRVKKTLSGTTTYFLVDDRNPTGYAQVLEEWTATGGAPSLSRVYNFGLALVSQKEGATVYYLLPDGHGSTRLLMDGNGSVANAFAYDAYGNLVASNTAPQTAYLYCGEYFDSHLGFIYLRDRLDNPQTGRFLTMDKQEGVQSDPASLHKYIYCGSDPANRVDRKGRSYELIGAATSAGIAVAVSSLVSSIAEKFVAERIFETQISQVEYATVDKAAIGVLYESDLIGESITEDEEYSGVIVQNRNQSFSYSHPKKGFRINGGKASYPPQRFSIPRNVEFAAGYHTHGNHNSTENTGLDEGASQFSGGDMDVSDTLGKPTYLGTPRYEVKKYTPKTPRKGKIELIYSKSREYPKVLREQLD